MNNIGVKITTAASARFQDQELEGKLGVVKLEFCPDSSFSDRFDRFLLQGSQYDCKARNTTYQKCKTEREKYVATW
jgi:hypothetical protein